MGTEVLCRNKLGEEKRAEQYVQMACVEGLVVTARPVPRPVWLEECGCERWR